MVTKLKRRVVNSLTVISVITKPLEYKHGLNSVYALVCVPKR